MSEIKNNPMAVKEAPYNPILLSEVLTKDCEMDLPDAEKFLIHFYSETTEVQIWFNSVANEPPLHLYKGGKWNLRSYNKVFKSLIIRFVKESSGVFPKLFVIAEDLFR